MFQSGLDPKKKEERESMAGEKSVRV